MNLVRTRFMRWPFGLGVEGDREGANPAGVELERHPSGAAPGPGECGLGGSAALVRLHAEEDELVVGRRLAIGAPDLVDSPERPRRGVLEAQRRIVGEAREDRLPVPFANAVVEGAHVRLDQVPNRHTYVRWSRHVRHAAKVQTAATTKKTSASRPDNDPKNHQPRSTTNSPTAPQITHC